MELIRHPTLRLGANVSARPSIVASLQARSTLSFMPANSINWLAAIPPDSDMLGNDRWGCCWEVARRWCIALRRAVAAGDRTRPTLAECLGDYSTLTGFDPISGTPDDGTDTTAGMQAWSTKGVQINSQTLDIPHWLTIDPTNDSALAKTIACAGPLMATWRLPMAMQDLSVWGSAPGTGPDWDTVWGEHETCLGGTDGKAVCRVRTWGQDIDIHPEIRHKFMIYVDVPLDLSPGGWFQTTGLTPTGLDLAALEADRRALMSLPA